MTLYEAGLGMVGLGVLILIAGVIAMAYLAASERLDRNEAEMEREWRRAHETETETATGLYYNVPLVDLPVPLIVTGDVRTIHGIYDWARTDDFA